MSAPNPGRLAAAEVLHRVANDGAWAAPTLSAAMGRGGLSRRDRALATEIVYGTLRVLPEVDGAVGAHLRSPAENLDSFVRAAFRTAAYQLLHLSAPQHAIVSDTVSIVRDVRGPKLGGLVNAVLRKVAAGRPKTPEPPKHLELPEWLKDKLVVDLGAERAEAFTAARPLPPPTGLRVRGGGRDAILAELAASRPDAEITFGDVSPNAILVRRAGDPREIDAYIDGRVAIQEQGAQVVGLLVGAQKGERVVDACAGRGGKTVQLVEAIGREGSVVALDLHEAKLERIGEKMTKLSLDGGIEMHAVDLTVGTAGLDGQFDRVLVDAPCTGLGTVHRRPEILLRTGPTDPSRMAEIQKKLLENACRLAKPGAVVTYAVCSPTAEEGFGVVSRVLCDLPDLVAPMNDEPWPFTKVAPDPDGIVRIGPWNGDCDAYQVARLRRI